MQSPSQRWQSLCNINSRFARTLRVFPPTRGRFSLRRRERHIHFSAAPFYSPHMPPDEDDTARNVRLGVRARRWARASARKTPDDARAVDVRVVSYNLLAPSSLDKHKRELYRVGSHRLESLKRARAVACELESLNADVVCAQEVEKEALEVVSERLRRSGTQAAAMATRAGKADGCVVLYNARKFEAESAETIYFDELERGLGDNVAVAVVLRHRVRDDFRVICVSAHLLFNPKRGDVKVGQARVLLDTVGRLRRSVSERGMVAHCVICGDYNFSPRSALYEFFSTGRINLAQLNRRELSGSLVDVMANDDDSDDDGVDVPECASETETLAMQAFRRGWDANGFALAFGDKSVPFPSRTGIELKLTATSENGLDVEEVRNLMRLTAGGAVLHHALEGELRSAYATVDGQEPEFTTCHGKFCGTNDYVWHTANGFEPTAVLKCPNVEDVLRHGRLPSVRYPSDHISLAVDFLVE